MKTIFRCLMIGVCLCVVAVLYSMGGGAASQTYASSAERPTVLPLPTVAPTAAVTVVPQPTDQRVEIASKPQAYGANIELVLPAPIATQDLRAVVQWQGHDERWYDVEGWQSAITDQSKPIDWWVSSADFGKGPFRWIVYRDSSKQPLKISTSFFLPTAHGLRLLVSWPH